jgi:hypothetical protein
MCIILGPVKPSNTLLSIEGLRQGQVNELNAYQVRLLYINDLQSSQSETIEGGIMVVPIRYLAEAEDPFFCDVKGENVANVVHAIQVATQPPRERNSRGIYSLSLSKKPTSKRKLEVIELEEGGYRASFAKDLKQLKDEVDIEKLHIPKEEWEVIYENTKLRFGEQKEKESLYGFVVAVPDKKPGLKRKGFGLVYWTNQIEFPTVHEQKIQSSIPPPVEMDVTLVGINVAIDGSERPSCLVDEKDRWSTMTFNLEQKKCQLPTHGIFEGKAKPIWPYTIQFVSYLALSGFHQNVNISGTFVSSSLVEKIKAKWKASPEKDNRESSLVEKIKAKWRASPERDNRESYNLWMEFQENARKILSGQSSE